MENPFDITRWVVARLRCPVITHHWHKADIIQRTNPNRDRKKPSTWIYLGDSTDAFDEHKSYLGPFNGHVNGSLVMKELQP
jgi:hypothetical protein